MPKILHGAPVYSLDEIAKFSNDPVTAMLIRVRDENKGHTTELSDEEVWQLGYNQLLRMLSPMAQEIGSLKKRIAELENPPSRLVGLNGLPLR